VSNPKPTVLFFIWFQKGRGNLRGSFFVASIDRIYWIFFFHHFPDESDEYETINLDDLVKSQNCDGKVIPPGRDQIQGARISCHEAYLAYAAMTTK